MSRFFETDLIFESNIKSRSGNISDSEYYYEAVRMIFGDQENQIPEESIDLILSEAKSKMTEEEWEIMEGFFSKIGAGLKKFGKGAVRIGKKALPVVGKLAQVAAPIVGTIFGGPAGGMAGAKIGNFLGKITQFGKAAKGVGSIIGGANTSSPRLQFQHSQPSPQIPINTTLNGNVQLLQKSQPATNQLLGLIQNPAFLQSLLGQVLGGRSQGTVRMVTPNVGGRSNIPFGSFMNLLGQLSTQAAIESNGHIKDDPTYLYDAEGKFAIENPDSNESRAMHLQNLLLENTYANYSFPKITKSVEQDPMTEWFAKSGILQ